MSLTLHRNPSPTQQSKSLRLPVDLRRDYGASGSAETTTGTISAGSKTLTLADAQDFASGQGIFLQHAGAACANGTPGGVSVTTQGTSGSTHYTYAAISLDDAGGYSDSCTYTTITTGNATLSNTNYNQVTVTPPSGNSEAPVALYGGPSGSPLQYITGLQYNWYGYVYNDNGTAYETAPSYLPATLPATGGVTGEAGWLSTTIRDGAGTTTLTLAAAATSAATDTAVYHDDTTAISNWLADSNGAKTIPPGTYYVSTSPTLDTGSDVLIQGQGETAILSPLPGTEAHALELLDCTDCQVQNVYVDGNKVDVMPVASERYTTLGGIYLRGCSRVLVQSCQVYEAHMGGIMVEGSTAVHVDACTARDCDDNGIFGRPGNTGFRVTGCRSTGGKFNGIACIRGSDVLFTGNVATGNGNDGTQEGAGLDFEGCLHSAMVGNLSYANLVQGIKVDYTVEGGTTSQRSNTVTLSGNVATGHVQTTLANGIVINGTGIIIQNADVVRTTGNILTGNWQGINVGSVTDFALDDLVYENTDVGINLYESTVSTAIDGPGTIRSQSVNNGAAGVYNSTISNIQYSGVFAGATGASGAGEGIQIAGGSRHRICGAVFYDNDDNGILVQNSAADVVVQDCLFSNTVAGSKQGRALYEASGAGPTYFAQNYVEGQANQPYSLSNSSSYATGNVGAPPMGWGTTTPSLPAATGDTVTNSNAYPVRIYQDGASGTTITDYGGTAKALAVDPNELTLEPGAKISYSTTVPSAWDWYGA